MAEKAREYPELRFQGFSGAWEKRKLSDISEKVTQKNTNNSFSEVFTNSAERGIISQLDFFDKDIANQKNISGYFIVKNDDFVYNPRISNLAPVGPIKRNKLGRNGVMSPLYYIFRTHSISPSFLEYYFEGTQWHYFMYLNGDTGARADRFAIKDSVFSTMPIFITSSSEQIQIGSFFKSLDELITVNQRKLNELKKLKKAYLQKMFPKNGVSIPELRFAGFTTPWEKRKSKSLFQSIVEKGKSNLPVLSVTQDSGVVFRDEIDINIKYDHSTLDSYKVVHPGDFVISLRSFQGGFELSNKLGITSPAYTIFISRDPSKQSNLFWEVQFKSYRFVESLKTVTFGVRDGKSISFKEFSDLKLLYPIDIKEQIQIGTFFKSLDDLITVNQRKLDKLKELKKGYLQKMFI
ncbi:type I restriction modification protein subunit S [Oenococcus oeni IOEB_C23]|uniref:restriction endonuclease subunit S n=1 Tax=Oenococcus oeni TaxID=1247 RepID=UPI00050E3396|nr:restriction endonuclease subunit S [Oenococcus oeni]KGH64601.1 type I restriction modification protein subunit S [Oenococcus oeni IOEB_C23]OIL21647.1 type I restriction endonuclease subunit S [Oenococcus oeni]OIL27397.1 type I restriction endonuclease subunit S [Oenococcus oeni]OIL43721.1 type I restriction endonuclease subunit S [Oenococcus oeni]WOC54046.1 restriction endonuclease subunit S [Oenococcus oeni]